MAFGLLEKDAVVIVTTRIPMLLVGPNANPWFRGNNLAEYLGYAQPRVAITKLTRARDIKSFAQLAPDVVANAETGLSTTQEPDM